MQLISGCKYDGRKEQVEEELVVEADRILDRSTRGESYDKPNNHS